MPRLVKAPRRYRCPLCLKHQNDEFREFSLIGKPVCSPCFTELDHHFSGDPERPSVPIVDRVEELTGLTWSECLVFVLRENLQYWQNIEREPDAFRDKFTMMSEIVDWTESKARRYVRSMITYYDARLTEAADGKSQGVTRGSLTRAERGASLLR